MRRSIRGCLGLDALRMAVGVARRHGIIAFYLESDKLSSGR